MTDGYDHRADLTFSYAAFVAAARTLRQRHDPLGAEPTAKPAAETANSGELL
ncbi:hypothetical protein C8E89_106166 [Mycolicibacterium moriokaense]|uniref:Uncharacterized protein n=1 Tax=Mycolicibacterium moriokaense TaxID=39691 RepID=A0A318HI16_9MYCO|nr:hypothetical protein C8E89_106166 [Mycolicibacterium moriokaense]